MEKAKKSLILKWYILLLAILLVSFSTRRWFIENSKWVTWSLASAEVADVHKPNSSSHNSNEVTLVTAYFNIGNFPKGSSSTTFTPELYRGWMRIFSKIQNPVVAFFDTESAAKFFLEVRKSASPDLSHKTLILVIDRKDLWSFSLLPAIRKIFSDPFYPKFLPNTVVPEYSCVMHAKYELMSKTISRNPFNTKYFAWIDIGLFRFENPHQTHFIQIGLPPEFNKSRVAYNEVFPREPDASPSDIFTQNGVLVCGCFFIGHKDVVERWAKLYMDYVVASLERGLMNTDQQVLYSMVNDEGYPLDVDMQLYGSEWGNTRSNAWFRLGYLCNGTASQKLDKTSA